MSKLHRTLILIKPDGVRRKLVGKIISRFEDKGFDILDCKMIVPTKEIATYHYIEHKNQPFFDRITDYISSGQVFAMILGGPENCYVIARKMIGSTFPENAEPGTIRGDLGLVRPENVIHGSDSNENAIREINIWFPENI